MNKISVRQSEDRFYWRVTFWCCDAWHLRFHDWKFAMLAANRHMRRHHAPQVLTAGTDSSPSKTADNPNDGRRLAPACREVKK